MQKDPIAELLADAKKHYRSHGRSHLPWRKTRDPYKVMVSEVMLQQTQVDRVIPFYGNFLKKFPNAKTLASAPLSEVLKAWNGLGYNRRAKMLRDAAKIITERHKGKFPKTAEEISKLPGIGPYTASAIATFAFNKPEIFIETNIRTVFFHHCFGRTDQHLVLVKKAAVTNTRCWSVRVSDREIGLFVEKALERSKMQPREFYWMLMDYGSFLKKSGVRLNNRSKHYSKQSKFEGSRRQLRGQILKLLIHKPHNKTQLARHTKRKSKEVREELDRLEREKLIFQGIKGTYRIAK